MEIDTAEPAAPTHRLPFCPTAPRIYNSSKQRRIGAIYYPTRFLQVAAGCPVRLVPIRLELEIEGVKISDTFTWNLDEALMTPEQFSRILIEDTFDIPPPNTAVYVAQIASLIQTQCESWSNAVDPLEENTYSTLIGSGKDNEWRTLIKLDLQVGRNHLTDQFEWPLLAQDFLPSESVKFNGLVAKALQSPTPESFSSQYCSDMGLGGEFVSLIAHSIREQLYTARMNFDSAPKSRELLDPPFRAEELDIQWHPFMEELDEEEFEQRMKEQERATRRMRRSQRASTGNSYGRYNDDEDDAKSSRLGSRVPFDLSRQRNYTATGQLIPNPNSRPSVHSINSGSRPYGYNSHSNFPPQFSNSNSQFTNPGIYGRQTQQQVIPYQKYKPSQMEQQEVFEKIGRTLNLNTLPLPKSPPKSHRGFGASAQRFNASGDLDVGEFREKWRCSWCLLSGKFTPTLRKGPMGSKTLCNSCGIWYGKHGNLPAERYQEHKDDE